MRTASLLLLLQSALLHAQPADLVGYWQNWYDASSPYIDLDQVDARYTVIEVAFALPATGTSYNMQFAPDQTTQAALIAQVATLHTQGRKVLISVGGANIDLQLNTDSERDQFASSVLDIISTYGFDGLDLDLESNSVSISGGTISAPVDAPVIRMIDAVKSIMTQFRLWYGHKMWLTMAPETYAVQGGQSAFSGGWGCQLPIVDALRDSLEILQVQLYNSGTMYGIDGAIYTQSTADFIVAETEAVLHGFQTAGGWFAPLPPEKVAIGLPACNDASGQGYTPPADVAAAIRYLRGEGPQPGSYTTVGQYPTLRGMMTWSINWDDNSTCGTPGVFAGNYASLFPLGSGIAETGLSNLITLSPNPATVGQAVRIDGTKRNEDVELVDPFGRRVMDARSTAAVVTFTLPSRLAAGLYLVRATDANGRERSARIVVQ